MVGEVDSLESAFKGKIMVKKYSGGALFELLLS
jgi:hypothetical protein